MYCRLTEFGPPMWQAEADTELTLSASPTTAVGQILLTMAGEILFEHGTKNKKRPSIFNEESPLNQGFPLNWCSLNRASILFSFALVCFFDGEHFFTISLVHAAF